MRTSGARRARVGRPGAATIRLAASAGLALVLAACGSPGFYVAPEDAGGSSGPEPSGAAPVTPGGEGSAEASTAWSNAIAGIRRDGTVPLETALAAFSVAFGPLPGVDTPQGIPEVIGSASGPTRWILAHWDALTTEQQTAVEGYLDVDGTGTSLDYPLIAGVGPLTAATLDEAGYQDLADRMAITLAEGSRLGRTLGVPIEVVLRDLAPSEEGETLFANTIPLDASGAAARSSTPKMARCQIQVGKATQVFESVVDQEAILAHEVFHCFQYSLAAKLADALAMPAWLAEGAGAWVGEEVAGGGSTIGNKYWQGWMAGPTFDLFGRSYTAIGFFAHLKTSGVDVWSLLDKMQLAAIGKSADAYLLAVGGERGEAAIDNWGPSYISDDRIGGEWFMDGPGKPPGSIAVFARASMADHDLFVVFEDPLTAYALRLTIEADVFVIVASEARGLMYDPTNGTKRLADILGTPFCLKAGGCTCEAGSAGEAHQFATLSDKEIFLGFTGHTGGVNVDLHTFPLDIACVQAPEDFIPPDECYCPPGPLGLGSDGSTMIATSPTLPSRIRQARMPGSPVARSASDGASDTSTYRASG